MLVLSRNKSQGIVIDGSITLTVVDTGNNTVKIGIDAPRDVEILRSELQTTKIVAPSRPLAASAPMDCRDNPCDFAI